MGDTLIDLTGQKFGRWSVLNRAENRGKALMWKCKCSCGTVKKVHGTSLKSGTSKSCGCVRKEGVSRTHGLSKHPLYRIWARMKGATTSKTHQDYKYYGSKGIKVCREWMDDFEVFYTWAMKNGYRQGLEIDRVDNRGDYEPSNCRWVDRTVQMNNVSSNVRITHEGKTLTVAQWSKLTGIPAGTIRSRLSLYGWSPIEAISTPVGGAR